MANLILVPILARVAQNLESKNIFVALTSTGS